jgi:O-acetyl-ADP-ribose deacetylase
MSGTFLDGRLSVMTGDITRTRADVIVNAANSTLLGGGGVDGAIHRAGGPSILEECRRLRATRFPGGLPAGDAAATTAGMLPARWIIHTVGPVWHGGKSGEPAALARCYRSCLDLAANLNAQSIAFPAISTGVYGYPREDAARVAWDSLSSWLAANPTPRTVILVFYSESDAAAFLRGSDVRP